MRTQHHRLTQPLARELSQGPAFRERRFGPSGSTEDRSSCEHRIRLYSSYGRRMPTAQTVNSEAFRTKLAPTVRAMRKFANAVSEVGARKGNIAWDGSPGMAELARESQYAERCSWSRPVTETHVMGGLTLRATADYARTYAETFAAEDAPIYGHLVLARAALEASVISAWLNQLGVGAANRIKRGFAEQIYSATEVAQLEISDPAIKREVLGRLDEWIRDARSLGWAVTQQDGKPWNPRKSRGKPYVDRTGRPPIDRGISRLVINDQASRRVGQLELSRLAAVSHVTWFGLRSGFILPAGEADRAGEVNVGIGTESHAVSGHAYFVVRALRRAAETRFALMGWTDDEWEAARHRAREHEAVLLRAYEAGLP